MVLQCVLVMVLMVLVVVVIAVVAVVVMMDGNTRALNDQQTGAPRKKKKGEASTLTASPFIFFLNAAVW
jgi:heme/copper-type cytochrome/quinol oxidase subunit 2